MNTGLFFFLVMGVFVLGGVSQLFMHEQVHIQNFKQIGIESHLALSGFTALTVPETNYKNDTDAQTTRLSNAVNEAVAYNVTPLVFMLSGVIIASSLYIKGGKE